MDKDIHGDAQREALSAFLRVSGTAVFVLSQSVRTIAECCRFDENNIELSISLLDQRFLIGDSDLFEQLADRCRKFFPRSAAARSAAAVQADQARHAKFHDTIYHLEPNIKEGPAVCGICRHSLARQLREAHAGGRTRP